MKNELGKLAITMAATAALALCGCITHHETVYRDVPRTKVEFENETAARIFYETVSQHPIRHAGEDSTTKVEIPVIFEHTEHVVSGDNVAFNESVKICDTNQDGRITELEAKIFAEHRTH